MVSLTPPPPPRTPLGALLQISSSLVPWAGLTVSSERNPGCALKTTLGDRVQERSKARVGI